MDQVVYEPSIFWHTSKVTNLPCILYPFNGVEECSLVGARRERLIEHIGSQLLPKISIPSDSQYAFVMSWMRRGDLVTDVHLYHDFDTENWQESNPTIRDFVLSGYNIEDTRDNSCGTSLLIRGREEELRRQTSNRDEYLSKRPNLGSLLIENNSF